MHPGIDGFETLYVHQIRLDFLGFSLVLDFVAGAGLSKGCMIRPRNPTSSH
jgi:hypothetical protein